MIKKNIDIHHKIFILIVIFTVFTIDYHIVNATILLLYVMQGISIFSTNIQSILKLSLLCHVTLFDEAIDVSYD